jgi:hypothetical protein
LENLLLVFSSIMTATLGSSGWPSQKTATFVYDLFYYNRLNALLQYLIPWSSILLEKQIFSQKLNEFPAFY